MVIIKMGSCILHLSLNKKNNNDNKNKNGSHSLNTYYMSSIGLSEHFELIII